MRLLSLAFIAALSVPAVAAVPRDAGDLIVAGDFGNAEPLVRERLAKQPGNPFARYNLAVILKNTGRYDEAITEYQRAHDIFQDTQAAPNEIGMTLYGIALTQELKGDPRAAVTAWDNYLRFAQQTGERPAVVGIARMRLDGQIRIARLHGYPFGPPTATRNAPVR